MATYEDGYRQALLDMRTAVGTLVNEPDIPNDGKVELFGVVSLINELIKGTIDPSADPAGREPLERPSKSRPPNSRSSKLSPRSSACPPLRWSGFWST